MVDPGALGPVPYGLYSPNGCYYIGLHKSHAECWRVALGWPSEEEIAWYAREGWYSVEGTFSYTNKSPRWPEGGRNG